MGLLYFYLYIIVERDAVSCGEWAWIYCRMLLPPSSEKEDVIFYIQGVTSTKEHVFIFTAVESQPKRVRSSKQLISHVLFDRLLPPSTTSSTWLSIHAHHTEINRLYHQLFLSSRNKLRRDSDGQTLGPSWVKQRQRSEKRLKGLLSESITFLQGWSESIICLNRILIATYVGSELVRILLTTLNLNNSFALIKF